MEDANKDDPAPVDKKVLNMMNKMGYKSGLGLGKNQQGAPEPVELVPQLGRRGLGLHLKDLQRTHEIWDSSREEFSAVETINWLENNERFDVDSADLETWAVVKQPEYVIEEEDAFCDKENLIKVLAGKNIFDELDENELYQARARANPFETIGSMFFMNRAALKLANIDAVTNFIFTDLCKPSPIYFADICAGPGGFSEYIFWRKNYHCKGFGMTLKGTHDFKVHDSGCASFTTFTPMYGAKGDGNVCDPENIQDFKEKVLHETGQNGVDFVLADGGFSVEGHEDIQEILSKEIYIAQCLIALEILTENGCFLVKFFDLFTKFSVGLMYLMWKCFSRVSILKPNSSRPANSERYFICDGFKGRDFVKNITAYLRTVVERLWELKDDTSLDVVEIVPLEILQNDTDFFKYITHSNNRIAEKQAISLQKLAAFCRNPQLIEPQQDEMRRKCLQFWNIPDIEKIKRPTILAAELFREIVIEGGLSLVQPRELDEDLVLNSNITDLNDWEFGFLQSSPDAKPCNFYIGVGHSIVHKLIAGIWVRAKGVYLPRGTLLYGEMVKERVDSDNTKYSLHIIDALSLGDVNIGTYGFSDRRRLVGVFAKTVNHEFRPHAVRIRLKPLDKLENLSLKALERDGEDFYYPLPLLGYKTTKESYNVNSILLVKTPYNKSFQETYLLRLQLYLHQTKTFETFLQFIKSLSKCQ